MKKKISLILITIILIIGIVFTNNTAIGKTFIKNRIFNAGNTNNLKVTDLIRIYNSETGFDFTVKDDTTIDQIKSVYGEPKLVTDSAFGGHAYTFYTDNNYSNYLYVETVLDDAFIFSYGTIWKEYQVYQSGYGEAYPFVSTSNLQGFIFNNGSKVAGGVYYNRNSHANISTNSLTKLFEDNYNSNPTKYLKGISQQGVLMYKAISKIDGYAVNYDFNEEYFYINEQMKDNNMSIMDYLIKGLRIDSYSAIGTRSDAELNSNNNYLFNPALFANFYYTDGTNKTDRNGPNTIAVFDYNKDNKTITAILVKPGSLDKPNEVALTSAEQTKLNNAQILYDEYKTIIDNQVEGESAYDVEPVISPPSSLAPGKIKDNYLQAQLKFINSIKAGAGFPYLSFDSELNSISQYDAVLLSYRSNSLGLQITHAPEQPAGVSDEFYNTARGWGLVGFSENAGWFNNGDINSNIMKAYTTNYLDDSTDLDGSFGHRITMLNPYMKTLGLGYAPNISVMRFRGGNDISNITAIGWPSNGVTPYEAFQSRNFYWSAHFKNNYTLTDKTNVKVECLNTGDTWNFTSDEAEINARKKNKSRQYIININTISERENRVLFYDSTLVPRPDYVYKITVSNIKDKNGNTTSYSYRSVIKALDKEYSFKTSNSIRIDRTNLKLADESNTYYVPIGKETKLNAILDEGTKDVKITWSINNSNITITQNGTVYPKTMISGKAKVTVKYDVTGITDTIYLKTYNPNQISMSNEELSIFANETKSLTMIENNSIGTIEKIEWFVSPYDNLVKLYSYDDEYIKNYLEITKNNDKSINIKAINYSTTNKFKITVKVTTNIGEYYGSSNVIVKIPIDVFKISHNNEVNKNVGPITNTKKEYGYLQTTSINRDALYRDNNTYIAKFKISTEPQNATEIPEFKWEIIENDGCISATNEKGAYKLNKIGKAKIKITNMSNQEQYDILNLRIKDDNNNLTGIQLKDEDLIYTKNALVSLSDYIESDDGELLDWKKAEISVEAPENSYYIGNYKNLYFQNNYLGNTYKVNVKYNNTSVNLTIRPITNDTINDFTLTLRKTSATLKKDEELTTSIYLKPNKSGYANRLFVNELSFDIYYDSNYINVTSATSTIENVVIKTYSNRVNVSFKSTDGPILLDSKDIINLKFKAIKNEDKTTYVELKNMKIKTGFPTNELEDVETNEKITINIVKYIPITSITLNKNSYTLAKGESFDLVATILPNDTTESKNITWTTSSKYIATVSNGKVTGVSQGNATITAKASNGMTVTCQITVTNPITNITLSQTSLSIKKGDFRTITASITPTNTTDDKTITWTSSNTNIATVSNGRITGVNPGTAKITAKTTNGKTATCTVTVTETEVPVTGISLNKTSLSLVEGNSEILTANITPSNATNKSITWTSSNTGIATVSNGKVNAVKAGTATITVKSNNGKTATCTVTVTAKNTEVAVTGISLNKTSLSLVEGNNETLTATITPSNATNKNITWTSSNTSIATVSNGNIIGVKAGTAIITAKTNNGKTITCTVTVTAKSNEEPKKIPVYRMYNPVNGEHLFTANPQEVETLYRFQGWGKEGIGWYYTERGTPVYRLYSPKFNNHLYTSNRAEITLITTQQGWVFDFDRRPVMYSNGPVSIYRLYNPSLSDQHHLTTSNHEYNIATQWGWRQEGVAMQAEQVGEPENTHYYR